ncbi:RNA polymerase subunit sigma-70 [Frankia sp. CcI156]|uniref:RNA polymerase, sigma subunit, ECF family n=1 Tax=Frankia casuarinae (strain DSM 45818 / CECT 9043 / HFP020203 / CcI3) TaxID=106370 RepID=Q2JGN3_FRACC|nr:MULTISPECIES: RNA polymerase sigma factor SigJ [Frankia]ABD09559.1 RNA polymerase, sigma subunit, ECF family [Frankia casuarinae]ETA03744.1 DNA-directed RNA polymerase specialized sigma subunit, sigma24 [Frankia sp. CcI6]EYT93587.1 DNA-directed RNA polymerase specialized sigma subunit, sigma24 [Frankia casuarinae]KDA43807.1 DNA-directed RNA polymerase specialized sigma subunit, sigma24 [Frankia sp. BMG5.23]KFB05391.1 RNA polymerase, sigma subunit, ECF family [Frankia sp. Allo2]
MEDATWQAEQFERQRPRLQAVAYRMLGSLSEAEDAVQEAWLRLSRSGDEAINNLGGWLTTVVGRVCIDMLRARQARREDFVGTWLPEPIVSAEDGDGPEQQTVLADSVGLALLVVLETLTPSERLAFVLHDMFAVPFEEIAPIVDRTPAAARQLASRARRRVRGAPTVPDPDLAAQRKVVAAFLAAARAGDFDALVAVLDPDVVFRVDTGSRTRLMPTLLTGSADVAQHTAIQGPRFARHCQPALVNGTAGIVARTSTGVIAVAGLTVRDGRIATIDLILDPDKLHRLVLAD